jgi:hypothetical protein
MIREADDGRSSAIAHGFQCGRTEAIGEAGGGPRLRIARKENKALKKGGSSSIRMKVSEKGALSVYGMGRLPVTLYKEQWLKLLDMADDIRAFIAAPEAELKAKDAGLENVARQGRVLTRDETQPL